jgi:hypothetical protein
MFRSLMSFHFPMFGFVAFAFLIVCGVLAVATFLVFKSGAHGETKLGGCAGCAIGFALLLIAGVAAAMCVGVVLVNTKSELIRRGPVRSLELQFPDRDRDDDTTAPRAPRSESEGNEPDEHGPATPGEQSDKDARHPVHLKLVVRGDEYPAQISEWVREHTTGDVSVMTVREGDRTIVVFGLPFTREQLADFKRELRESMPGMKLPKSIKVEIKDEDED